MKNTKVYLSLLSALFFAVTVLPASAKTKPEFVGFNAKGRLNTIEQLTYTDQVLSAFPASALPMMNIRVTGGTVSQTELPSDWTDSEIVGWINLQKKFGFRFIYVVNGNDTPQNQLAFIQKWINQGAKFSFIEMMNEYYLPRFRSHEGNSRRKMGNKRGKKMGKKGIKPEPEKTVTPDSYVNQILPEYFGVLKSLKLPMFVIAAPEKPGAKPGNPLAEWNRVVLNGMKKYTDFQWGVTVHLYKRDGSFPYDQIDHLRAMVPAGTSIAVTEAGILDKSIHTYEQMAPLVQDHYKKISAHLKEGDYFLDHILYNNYSGDVVATTHPAAKGITAKGTAVISFFKTLLAP